ncbi:transposase [candidate division WOR-3 bacterium]|nr:transposase [candidate division WOR-3 bacterium]
MARPLRILFPGAFYHVMCRGNERKRIFLDDDDRSKFILYLKESIQMYHVHLHAYVLMHNHFHLVVETLHANLNEFMRRFNICYTGWFHYHHKTCGHLYQGRYKAILVDADNYLVELSRYVHLNPVRTMQEVTLDEQWQYLTKYTWSSLAGYFDKRRRLDYINYSMIDAMIGGSNSYKHYLYDGLKNGVEDILYKTKYQLILGDDRFLSYLQNEYVKKGSRREQPAYRKMTAKLIDSEILIAYISTTLNVDIEKIRSPRQLGPVRGIVAEMLYQYSGLSLSEIGKLLGGINYTAVSMLRKRLKVQLQKNKSIRDTYMDVKEKLCTIGQVTCEDLTPSI